MKQTLHKLLLDDVDWNHMAPDSDKWWDFVNTGDLGDS